MIFLRHHKGGGMEPVRLRRKMFFLGLITLIHSQSIALNLTFFALSDTHYGNDAGDREANRAALIETLNALPGRDYPLSSGGGTVSEPRGILLPGDVTENPDSNLWNRYAENFGVEGEGKIRYPVYDGLGNHDEPGISQGILPRFIQRNALRREKIALDSTGYHYSWDWDGVHFINLNLYSGTVQGTGIGNPLGAVDFLKQDLQTQVGNSGRPVFVMQHYPFDAPGFWWQETEKQATISILSNYNVIGLLNGHSHIQRFYSWNGLNAFDDGTAMSGEALVFHITEGRILAVNLIQGEWGNLLLDKNISMGNMAGLRPQRRNSVQTGSRRTEWRDLNGRKRKIIFRTTLP